MSTSLADPSLLLPPESLLFYIGAPKTGTTTVQHAAARARKELLAAGVYYPGTGPDHRRPVYAFMRKRIQRAKSMTRGAKRASAVETPAMSEWNALMADVASEPTRRILISCEEAARASDKMAAKFVDALGRERTHIAITLRAPAAMLPSQWVELLKTGESATFDDWLARVYGKTDKPIPASMQLYLDMAGLVERWASAVGPDRVTVIVSDSSNHDLLTDAFEQLLGLPDHTLTGSIVAGDQTNRSMSAAEAEVFRALNQAIYKPDKLSWPLYLDVVQSGAMRWVLGHRSPAGTEPRVRLPKWAAEMAVRDGKEHARRIAGSGVRVVGNLENLYAEPRIADDEDSIAGDYRIAIAVESLVGAVNGAAKSEADATRQITSATKARDVAAAERDAAVAERDAARVALADLRRAAELRKAPSALPLSTQRLPSIHAQVKNLPLAQRAQQAADAFATSDLVRAVALRLTHRLFTGKSMPGK